MLSWVGNLQGDVLVQHAQFKTKLTVFALFILLLIDRFTHGPSPRGTIFWKVELHVDQCTDDPELQSWAWPLLHQSLPWDKMAWLLVLPYFWITAFSFVPSGIVSKFHPPIFLPVLCDFLERFNNRLLVCFLPSVAITPTLFAQPLPSPFPFYRLQPVSVSRPDPRSDSKCHSLPSVALGLRHSAWLGNWFSVHCVEQSRCSVNPASGPGTLLLSAEAHKFLSDN